MSKVKIGWSEVDITPSEKISLAGQFFERISDEVESPIAAVAMAVESGDDQMIICAVDLEGIAENLFCGVKERVAAKTGLSADKVIVSAIHSHTSYDYKRSGKFETSTLRYLEQRVPSDMQYLSQVSGERAMDGETALEFLIEKIGDACVAAWENRAPAYYKNAFGRAAVGMCRRVVYDDGQAKMWGDTNHPNFLELEGGNDSGIELIYTYDENKELTGVVANIACPAQVVEHRSFISSDYWGKVRENLRKHFGEHIKVLGLCSAAGDQCPRDMIRWVNPEAPVDDPHIKRDVYIERRADPSMFDVSGLRLVGRRISNEIISVYEELDGELCDEAFLEHRTLKLPFPLRRVTISEYENAVEMIDRFIDKNRGRRISFEDNAKMHVYSGIIARYELQKGCDTFTEDIHVIRFGDIAIVSCPFELFLDYGNIIRARSLAKQTVIIQLACGAMGYLPTEKAERGSHYSAYVSSGFTGHAGGDLLVREAIQNINDMFRK